MRDKSFSRNLGLVVAWTFLIWGTIECTVSFIGRDQIFFFWFASLIGGGVLVLFGTLRSESQPRISLVALVLGAIAGCMATVWTILIPLLAILLVFVRLAEAGRPPPAAS